MRNHALFPLLLTLATACTSMPTITQEELNRQLALARQNCNREIEDLRAQLAMLQNVSTEKAAIETRFITVEQERVDASTKLQSLEAEVADLRRIRTEVEAIAAEAALVKERAAAAERERDSIRGELQKFIDIGGVGVEMTGDGVTITMRDAILFDPGKADLRRGSDELLKKLSEVLSKTPVREIRVAGHSDNTPIRSADFPSNWELSTARALSVLHKLMEVSKIPNEKFVAIGFGEHRPIAPNTTSEGRARNRRVEIYLVPVK